MSLKAFVSTWAMLVIVFIPDAAFLPLSVGNVWQYRTEDNSIQTISLLSDTMIDNEHWYVISGDGTLDMLREVNRSVTSLLVFDSSTHSTYRYFPSTTSIMCPNRFNTCFNYSLVEAPPISFYNDTGCQYYFDQFIQRKCDTTNSLWIGTRPSIVYRKTAQPMTSVYSILADGIGIVFEQTTSETGFWRAELIYAKINGIEYGNFVSSASFKNNPIAMKRFSFDHYIFFDLLGRKVGASESSKHSRVLPTLRYSP